ncbi:MAG: hypothetical protein M0024_12815 [Nitrospiraceae bacterium]|nr:hypothetical protein [Nitrospiraceae bacterium]
MCVDHSMNCVCGFSSASFNFRDEVMPVEVINRLYCPKCSPDIALNAASMIRDNGWIIDFDMDVARFAGQRLQPATITPEYLFDEGYCTWRGVHPTDHIDSVREREDLVKLSRSNPKKYIEEFKKWGAERMSRLEREGWRKAREAE